jgi:hypothetical protein
LISWRGAWQGFDIEFGGKVMKRRGFLLPFAVSVAALLGSNPVSGQPVALTGNASPAEIASRPNNAIGDLVIERASAAGIETAQHASHYSHRSHSSHSSHSSHVSHQSHYSGY